MVNNIQSSIENALNDLQAVLTQFTQNKTNIEKIEQLSSDIVSIFKNKGKVMICGNGGSHCDAMHFAEEFTGRFRKNRKALPVIALGNAAHVTCVGNDFGFNEIFSREVEAYAQPGDAIIVMSTSGNSENIMRAVQQAKEDNLQTIAFLGKGGGKLKGICDVEFIIEAQSSDRIQEIHMSVLHILIECIERQLFPENYKE
jgi:D-sedoheptulose 7-phosphate isomerase